jgi:hypothetical protein
MRAVLALAITEPPRKDVALPDAAAAVSTPPPAPSSPMKVRDEPVTLWTMEMLPASRLESCARKSVGRRSLDEPLVEIGRRARTRCRTVQDAVVDDIALAAIGAP